MGINAAAALVSATESPGQERLRVGLGSVQVSVTDTHKQHVQVRTEPPGQEEPEHGLGRAHVTALTYTCGSMQNDGQATVQDLGPTRLSDQLQHTCR